MHDWVSKPRQEKVEYLAVISKLRLESSKRVLFSIRSPALFFAHIHEGMTFGWVIVICPWQNEDHGA